MSWYSDISASAEDHGFRSFDSGINTSSTICRSIKCITVENRLGINTLARSSYPADRALAATLTNNAPLIGSTTHATSSNANTSNNSK